MVVSTGHAARLSTKKSAIAGSVGRITIEAPGVAQDSSSGSPPSRVAGLQKDNKQALARHSA